MHERQPLLHKKFDINYIFVGALMLAVLLRFPWVLIYNMYEVEYRPVIQLFTHPAVGMLAVGFLLCNLQWFKTKMGIIPIVLISIIFISCSLHICIDAEVAMFEMMALVAVPLLIMFNYRIAMRLLPWCIGIFWFLNIIETYQYYGYFYDQSMFAHLSFSGVIAHWWTTVNSAVGFPGNNNWQAAFLVASTPFAMWCSWRVLEKLFPVELSTLPLFIGIQIPIVILAYIPFHSCDSRGATLALWVFLILTLFLFFMRCFKDNLVLQRKLFWSIIGGFLLIVLLGFLVQKNRVCYEFEKLSITDVRIPMWTAATRMIFETQIEPERPAVYTPRGYRFLLGAGCEYFEDQYVTYRAANYFCRTKPASRTDYPHNFSFYTLGAMGIPAGLAWMALVLGSLLLVYRQLMRAQKLDVELFVITWLCGTLYLHTQLDLVLEYWPMCGFFLMGLGCLWYNAFKINPQQTSFFDALTKSSKVFFVRWAGIVLGFFVLSWLGVYLYNEYNHHLHEREAMILNDYGKRRAEMGQKDALFFYNQANKEFRRALFYKPSMEVAYLALTNATWSALGNPAQMDYYIDFIREKAKRYNYCNVPQITAYRAHEKGDWAEYEKQLEFQTTIYPVGPTYALAYYDFLMATGNKENQAKASMLKKKIDYMLRLKGFEPTEQNYNLFRGKPQSDLTLKETHYLDRKIALLRYEYFGEVDTELLKNPIPWPSMSNPLVVPEEDTSKSVK